MARISVCMATYNGEKYIEEQIKSILSQISTFDELIISDDYSTDSTLDIIRNFNDPRIRIVHNKLQNGCSSNFENAINCSSGDIIFLSDQDDLWMEGRVSKMIQRLEGFQLVVCNAQIVDKELRSLNETYFSLRGGRQGFLNNLYKLTYLGACMAFKREILYKVLPFPRNKYLCPHDMWIALVAEFYFKVNVIEEPLVYYRRHGENASNGGQSSNSIWIMILFRMYALKMVLSRIFK